MRVEALKLELLDWLLHIENSDTLEYLKIIKEQEVSKSDWWDDLSVEQKAGIERGLKDVDEGRVIAHDIMKSKHSFLKNKM